jgi:hypothetical protein
VEADDEEQSGGGVMMDWFVSIGLEKDTMA